MSMVKSGMNKAKYWQSLGKNKHTQAQLNTELFFKRHQNLIVPWSRNTKDKKDKLIAPKAKI